MQSIKQLTEDEVDIIAKSINKSFKDKQVSELKISIPNGYFITAKQAGIILKQMWRENQKEAGIYLYDHLSDKNNLSIMLNNCWSSAKEDILKYLKLK